MSIIIDNVEQGSAAWGALRLGIPTASEMKRVVTPTGKLSTGRDTYLAELLAEHVLGEPVTEFGGNFWTERGTMLEPQALEYFQFVNDVEVDKVGIVFNDDSRMVAASPDGLIGDDGGVEIKNPAIQTHLLWLARGGLPKDHYCQVQSSMWITGRNYWHFLSYYPGMPPLDVRCEPDEQYHKALDKYVPQFIDEILAGRERLEQLGAVVDKEPGYADHYTQTGGTL